ncbi:hypothetical protein H4W29_004878 [Rhizobium viscosum]|uniref:Uncharacterized protein n=1 Tax=Rhizobium viscosum TaxID=1673 RepID=A0ABR9IWS9_RHIVS|nr:hypothetical protein [Rhizobium viscosum]MBE1507633.1 hypothetical protein [Rhizobium viscosum]
MTAVQLYLLRKELAGIEAELLDGRGAAFEPGKIGTAAARCTVATVQTTRIVRHQVDIETRLGRLRQARAAPP